MLMVQGLASLGFETICATPHQKAGQFLPARQAIDQAHQELSQKIDASDLAISIPLAAENMWDDVFFSRLQQDEIPSYNNGPAFLVEFQPSQLPVGLSDHLFELTLADKLPVIAHPERYQPLWAATDTLIELAQHAALVVDLGALAGYHGRKQAKAARMMVKQGIAHAAASDAHSPNDIRVAAEGIAWIRKKVGDAAVTRLLTTNPRMIIAGQHPG